MKLRDIGVCLTSPDQDLSLFTLVRDLAKARDAHLSCALFSAIPNMMIGGPDGDLTGTYAKAVNEVEADFRKGWEDFERDHVVNELNIEVRKFMIPASGAEAVAAMDSRHCDIVFVPSPARSRRHPEQDIAEGAILGGGRPVVTVPKGWKDAKIGARAVIAWHAGRESARALHDYLLLAPENAEVSVVTVDAHPQYAGYGEGPGWDIGAHIARHGLKVDVRNEDSVGRTVAQVLLDVATYKDANLIVLGGYRHSRLQQSIVPGVTRTLLLDADLPLLISH